MLGIKYKKIETAFVDPFATAHGVKTHQPALQIAISYKGVMGIGEAPAISYYGVSVERMIEKLLQKVEDIGKYAFTEPSRFWHFCHHLFPQDPFLVCALDMAYWDMYARIENKSFFELFESDSDSIIKTDYTLGIDSAEKLSLKMKEVAWPFYKLKVESEESISILEGLAAESDAKFCIDANQAWTLEEAVSYVPRLEKLNIAFIEQPLAKDDYSGHKKLKEMTSIPIIADESFVSEHDLEKCIGNFDGINIKLTKCSGITPALRIIKEGKDANMKLMLGCMSETEYATYVTAHLAPFMDFVDLDGPMLLDVSLKRLKYEAGVLSFL